MSVIVRDETRELRFDGTLLAEATSEVSGKDRWIEFSVYKTAEGNYVLSRVGRSKRTGETDRFSAQVSETPQGVLETLYLYDEDGVRYLTRVARELLDRASDADEAIATVYRTETIK